MVQKITHINKDINFKKTIRSTPGGFCIHSPFVFHLVTRGMFAKKTGIPAVPAGFTRQEKATARLMVNLIRFLRPEELVTPEKEERLAEWITLQHRKDSFLPEGVPYPLPFPCRTMVIISGRQDTVRPVLTEEVWVVPSLQKKEQRGLWESALMIPGVRVSVETRSTGILFFHPVLQKERYVIRSWFYL